MRILLDESLPRALRELLHGHIVSTVAQMGWSATRNGELLRLASDRFDVFLTADQNLQFQQNLAALPLPVIALVARSNRIEDLVPLVPAVLKALLAMEPRSFSRVSVDGRVR